ncbi:MAG TPA: LuxR C-terminal-related transcriptional regulator [Chryseosolibacter sp.]
MRKTILYGLALALLIFFMKMIEYKFVVRELAIEFYIGIIAVMFTVVGIWAGLKLTSSKKIVVTVPESPFVLNEESLRSLGISKREHEVLELMAQGLSNQEIADRLFVSLNTVKTHTSSLFVKLDVKRRTQAVQKGKELNLIP